NILLIKPCKKNAPTTNNKSMTKSGAITFSGCSNFPGSSNPIAIRSCKTGNLSKSKRIPAKKYIGVHKPNKPNTHSAGLNGLNKRKATNNAKSKKIFGKTSIADKER